VTRVHESLNIQDFGTRVKENAEMVPEVGNICPNFKILISISVHLQCAL